MASDSGRGASALGGRRIVITRPEEQGAELAKQLESLGAHAILCPAIAIAPPESTDVLDRTLLALESYDWVIFTSANALAAVLTRLAVLGVPTALASSRIAVVGSATAAAAMRANIVPSLTPQRFLAEGLLAELGDVGGLKVLLPRADIARADLPAALRARGAQVDEVVAYRTVPHPSARRLAELLRHDSVDAICFASPSAVRACLEGLEDAGTPRARLTRHPRPGIISIGPVTAAEARQQGLPVDEVAADHDSEGLIAAMSRWFESHPAER
ncbi:MAG: uroporphyrinogen-III synthase [Gemmatimonadota bacterium]|nr:uroporphyrinogen-III synthase [Gemmatimonadota bacterium]